ncbi:hypothetical protein [Alistipes sp.]
MIYELSFEGHTLGYFLPEAEASAGREWAKDDEFMMFNSQTNISYELIKK